MAATDLVPCFYTGQNYRIEKPAALRPRSEVREFKNQNLGKFVENGKCFLFFQVVAQKAKQLWDGLLGTGNALPFAKPTTGDPLHYEIPHAGDRCLLHRHNGYRLRDDNGAVRLHTKTISVSSRNQIWPARGPQFRFA